MNRYQQNLRKLILIGLMLCFSGVIYAEATSSAPNVCLLCHKQTADNNSIHDIFKTAHGNLGAKQGASTGSAEECEACHGPAGEHITLRLKENQRRQPMIAFNSRDSIPIAKKNQLCLNCHLRKDLNHWQGSVHQLADTACTSCHQIHIAKDPMRVNSAQVETCGRCHAVQKLAHNKASTHPLREGIMGCSDCHNPHDADDEKLLIGDTVNQTCFQCHAEKRGPFLWEHEPVSDSCNNCHSSHGSNTPAMLNQLAPYLCQSCHSSIGHPSIATGSESLPAGNASAFLLGRSCVNCHSKVHGSNHPSGAQLQQ